MKNVTITLDRETAAWTRVHAARRNLSVSRFVGEVVRELMAWRPLPVDEALLWRAREIEQRWDLSWRDSMVVGAAQLQDCVLLLTGDLPDGAAFGGVTARSPFTLAAEEPSAIYAVTPLARSRHRPRGRPKQLV